MDEPHGPIDELRMSFGEHLEELRWRLILSMLGVAACCGVTLMFGQQILAWLCVPLMEAQRAAGVPAQTYAMSPLSGFSIYLKVSLVSAVILAVPWIFYQLWRFIETGLYQRERRLVMLLAPFSTAMAVAGVAFLYYVLLPVCLWFLISFSTSYPAPTPGRDSGPGNRVSSQAPLGLAASRVPVVAADPVNPPDGQLWFKTPENELRFYFEGQTRTVPLTAASMLSPLIEINQYINFVVIMAIGCLVAFQLPVGMLVVGWTGLVNPALIERYRRYCVFGCFVVGMILTPSDVLSMILMSLPLWALFELGLILMKIADRRRRLHLP